MKRKYRCMMCGRVFSEGQGIVINYGGKILAFHSSRCASKFLRLMLDRVPEDVLGKYINRLMEELEETLGSIEKLRSKKI